MRIKLEVMYLGSKIGNNSNGETYYQGQFLEKTSNQSFRMYFPDDEKLNEMIPYEDYDLECELYINNKGLWVIRGV